MVYEESYRVCVRAILGEDRCGPIIDRDENSATNILRPGPQSIAKA